MPKSEWSQFNALNVVGNGVLICACFCMPRFVSESEVLETSLLVNNSYPWGPVHQITVICNSLLDRTLCLFVNQWLTKTHVIKVFIFIDRLRHSSLISKSIKVILWINVVLTSPRKYLSHSSSPPRNTRTHKTPLRGHKNCANLLWY